MITILIVDDQDLVRLGLRTLIASEDDLSVVGEAADGLAAVAQTRALRPDVVLMDVRMPGIDGIEATRRIVADPTVPETKVIVLTTFELDEYVFDALRHGASGFLIKDTKPAELLRAIRLVAAGDALLSPSVTRRVVREFANRPARRPRNPARVPGARALRGPAPEVKAEQRRVYDARHDRLLPRLAVGLVGKDTDVLAAALGRVSSDRSRFATLLGSLKPLLGPSLREGLAKSMREVCSGATTENRSELLAWIQTMAPLMPLLGGEQAAIQTLEAIDEAGRMWP